MARARDALIAGSDVSQPAPLQPAMDRLRADAEHYRDLGPWSVTDKTKTPPSGDKRDYYSVGPYWWPNPKTKDGLPYIRRDGETNPDRNTDAFDTRAMGDFSKAVEALTLSGFFDRRMDDSSRAAELIRHWFITPGTRMNPNLTFAQSIPGRTDGRGIGIIDTYRLVPVVESARLLERSGALSPTDMTALRQWFGQYALWMATSENGREERMAENNHGIYFDAQLAQFASFAGDESVLPIVMKGVVDTRIRNQIDRKGRMPRELKRTRSFHYTAFTLRGLIDLAELSRCEGPDLYAPAKGRHGGLTDALEFQASYIGRLDNWPYEHRRPIDTDLLFDNLCRSAGRTPTLDDALSQLRAEHLDDRVMLLTNGCEPSP